MIRKIVIDFDTISWRDSIRVLITFSDYLGEEQRLVEYLSSIPQNLQSAFSQWQQYINSGNNRELRKIRVEPNNWELPEREDFPALSNNINFAMLAQDLSYQLNAWLDDENWSEKSKVRNALGEYHEKIDFHKEEIQIVIQTEDQILRRIPWQEWNVLKRFCELGAEVTLGASEYKRPIHKNHPQLRARVRILAVFGNNSLETYEERILIKKLPKYGGEIEIITEPTKEVLVRKLQDLEGWHIFFFAGHSGSDANKKLAWIEIAPGERLSTKELLNLFRVVVNDKLQLAIFNSCDGLGLANQLTSISLPYCIVMREEVESSLARSFLPQFLYAFVRGGSLLASMSKARKFIREEFDQKRKHPGKSWLPIIVANPLAKPLTWDGMFTERRLNSKWEWFLAIIITIFSIGLPLAIWSEFHLDTLLLYGKLYPHLVIYPSIFLWVSMYSIYRMFCLVRQKTYSFITIFGAIILISVVALITELHSDPIFLFEIKPHAILSIELDDTSHDIQDKEYLIHTQMDKNFTNLNKDNLDNIIEDLINKNIYELSANDHTLMKIFLTSNVLYKNSSYISLSRWFYALTYFGIILSLLSFFPLLYLILRFPNLVFKKKKYFAYIFFQVIGLLPWVSCHYYYTIKTKSTLFGEYFHPFLSNFYTFIYICIFIISLLITFAALKIENLEYRVFISTLTIIFVALFFILGNSESALNLVDNLIGMKSNAVSITWLGGLMILPFIFVLIFNLADRKVEE